MTLADVNRDHLDSDCERLIAVCRERMTQERVDEVIQPFDFLAMTGDPRLSVIARYAASANVRVRLTFEPVGES